MFKMQKQFISIGLAVLLGLLAVTGVWAVTVEPWSWVGAVTNVSESGDVRANVSLAAGEDDIAVVWAGGEDAPGLYIARNTGSGWTRSAMTITGDWANRFPALVLFDGQPLVAWSQSEGSNPADSLIQNLLQQDGTSAAQKIAGPIYGRVVPDMDLATTGLHLVFPAATTSYKWSQHDMYYAHRYLTETTWSAPTVVLTHGQVLPATAFGKIWHTKQAVSPDGQTLHLVWEQYEQYTGQQQTIKVWYISGTWQPDGVVWGTAMQISPSGQDYAVRPNIAVAASGKVHIVWTELVLGSGGLSDVDRQFINYLQFSDPTITKVNVDPIKVNSNSPTWASSALGLYKQTVCVSWHGFYAGASETLEEITLRCSKDEGSTWLSLMNVSASPDLLSDFPAMAFDARGLLHIAWEEREIGAGTYEPLDIYYRGGLPQPPPIFLPLVVRQGS